MTRWTKKSDNGYELSFPSCLLEELDEKDITRIAMNKLGKLEEIETKLGVDLDILWKAIEQQKVWVSYDNKIDCCDSCDYMLGKDFIYFYWDNGKHLVFKLSDYRSCWALTKEELILPF